MDPADLKGATVIVLPDNDEPGRYHAKQVAKSLHGVAASVKVLTLPGLPEGGDVYDWIAAGGTAEKLWALVEAHGANGPDSGSGANDRHGERILNPLNAADFEGKPVPERKWEVENYIPQHKPVLLYGDGGVGKSTIAQQLAVAKSARRDWLFLKTQPGRTLFLSAEDDDDEFHIRLDCIRADMGLQCADLADVQFQSLMEQDPTLGAFSKQQGKVIGTPLLHELEERVRDTMIDLVILDTLSDVFEGNENDRQQARAFIRLLARLGLKTQSTVLALAHPSVSGMATGTGMSGSTGWNNTARARMYFYSEKDDEDDVRTLQVMKANYGPPNLRTKVRWQRGLYVPVTEAAQEAKAKYSAEAAEECFLRLLDAYTKQDRHVSHKSGANYAPHLFAKDKQSGGVDKAALTDAMNRLLHSGVIKVEAFGPPSRPLNRIIRT